MNPAVDHFIEIGSQHRVCEDYIMSGMFPIPHVILADGCSSSKQTEMGARFLCYLAKQYLCYRYEYGVDELDYNTMGMWIIHNAEMIARQMGLNRSCLDATLIIAVYDQDSKEVMIFMYGDGFVLAKREGVLGYQEVSFTGNAPYYLSYKVDPFRDQLYHEAKNEKLEKIVLEGELLKDVQEYAYDRPSIFAIPISSSKEIFICSDGMASFIEDHKTPPFRVLDIAPGFLDFKTTKGEYLKRRCSKESKLLRKRNISHYDDLSIGGFLFKED